MTQMNSVSKLSPIRHRWLTPIRCSLSSMERVWLVSCSWIALDKSLLQERSHELRMGSQSTVVGMDRANCLGLSGTCEIRVQSDSQTHLDYQASVASQL